MAFNRQKEPAPPHGKHGAKKRTSDRACPAAHHFRAFPQSVILNKLKHNQGILVLIFMRQTRRRLDNAQKTTIVHTYGTLLHPLLKSRDFKSLELALGSHVFKREEGPNNKPMEAHLLCITLWSPPQNIANSKVNITRG